MNILNFVFTVIMGFSLKNVGESNFVGNEILKSQFSFDNMIIDSALVLEESGGQPFLMKNLGFQISFKERENNISFGFGNFEKSGLYFQKSSLDFSLWNNFFSDSKNFSKSLTLPSLSDGKQPFGFGLSFSGERLFIGFNLFSYETGFSETVFSDFGSLFSEKNHFCFMDFGVKGDFKTFPLSYLFESTLGYVTFSQNQSKSSWFSDKNFLPSFVMPVFTEKSLFSFDFEKVDLETGLEFWVADVTGLRFCFLNENQLKVGNFSLGVGILFSDFDFPLLNGGFIEKDFQLKITPSFIHKGDFWKSDFGVSGILERALSEYSGKNPMWTKNHYDLKIGFGVYYSFYQIGKTLGDGWLNDKKISGKVQFQVDDLFIIPHSDVQLFLSPTNFDDFLEFVNLEAFFNASFDFQVGNLSFSLDNKIQVLSNFDFWENPENQYSLKIQHSLERENIKLSSDLKFVYKDNQFFSEEMALDVKIQKVNFGINLEIENQAFYQYFIEKNAEKSGINLGISGTINL